ncbi:hypothetical protein [Deinococcus sp. QL22]|uniref:hypothetical protein n=1 Tax=Deinococcus sp. QL22 TaxID=2939437 RepID=UPI0020177DB1|nr:hypothetical protein [Deinococcus sp. QL22]UQN08441.1 hypothetical protein M1R55_17120 [Deinococcus sp. QL22]
MRIEAIDKLLNIVSDEYRESILSWESAGYPSLDVINCLIEIQLERPPYAPLLLHYAVCNSEPKLVEKRLKYLNRCWREMWIAQHRPSTFKELDRTTSLADLRQHSGRVARQVLEAITDPTSVLLSDIRCILPNEYLPLLGLSNFAGYIPATILKIADQRFKCHGGAVPEENRKVIKRIHSMRKTPYVSELILAVSMLTDEESARGERNTPNSVLTKLTHTASLLKKVFADCSLKSMVDFDPDLHLRSYFKDESGQYLDSVRVAHISAYLECADAGYRWERAHPDLKASVAPWRLRSPKGHIDEDKLFAAARQAEKNRRYALADALAKVYLPTLSAVIRRAAVFQEIAAASEVAHRQFASLSAEENHLPFEVCLSDGSATLRFVIWSAAVFAGKRSLTKQLELLNQGDQRETLVEYVGAVDEAGQPLPDAYFALVQRAWYDPEFRPQILKYGGVESDYLGTWPGLLRPAMRLSGHCHKEHADAHRSGRKPRVLFDLKALCAGAAYGAFVLVVAYSSGMRTHEMQQINGRAPDTVILESGHFECSIYKKGKKRDKKKIFKQKLEPFVRTYWEALRDAHYKSWGDFSYVLPQDGEKFGFERGGYLLQADGRRLSQVVMRRSARFVAFGACHDSTDPDFMSLAIHLLRHGHTRIREELGHLLSDIQKDWTDPI